MAIELKLRQGLSQNLVMTPQLQQAIKLLQLNRMELQDVVNQELMENPLLEEVAETTDNPEGLDERDIDASSDPTVDVPEASENKSEDDLQTTAVEEPAQNKNDDIDWEQYIEELNNERTPGSNTPMNTEELPSFENILTKTTSLSEHLLWQLGMTQFTDNELKFGDLVIGNIDEDGYLPVTVEELAGACDLDPEDAVEVLKIMQRFDPIGVCSRSLAECLMAQAEFMSPRNNLVETIIANHMNELEKKNYSAIAKTLGISVNEVIGATKIILELEPKPGRQFVTSDNTEYITPDIYVYKVGNEFVISLNEDGMPRLRISNYYKNVLTNAKKDGEKGKEDREFIQKKLKSALWLIQSLQHRQKTIYRVTESIVRKQRDFFDKGISAMKPMILKDVADDVGIHESTVSRVTTNKYVHTPVGMFELKYFFNSSISSVSGGFDVASESVKEKIKYLVSKEDQKRPLSDEKIVDLLKGDNIDVARRTVAKYREGLGILSSSKRKKIF